AATLAISSADARALLALAQIIHAVDSTVDKTADSLALSLAKSELAISFAKEKAVVTAAHSILAFVRVAEAAAALSALWYHRKVTLKLNSVTLRR
ncbi:hypothetical protein T492DRAFT_889188, partial [Pavlovales sp. CCMP2436]